MAQGSELCSYEIHQTERDRCGGPAQTAELVKEEDDALGRDHGFSFGTFSIVFLSVSTFE